MNPFRPLYKACDAGPPVAPYPIMLDIELTSSCNMRCRMCPTGLRTLERPAGFMEPDVYAAIVAQMTGRALRFIGWGEPMLHPDLVKFVAAASGRGILTHVNTNGTKLTPTLARELVVAGLSSIKFSFQGVDAPSYLDMRKSDFFEGLLQCIEMMVKVRGKRSHPWIAVSTTTTTESRARITAFRQTMEEIRIDELSVGKTIFDYLELDDAPLDEGLVHPSPCPEVWHKLEVSYDGSVRVCCNDYKGVTNLGNVLETSIEKIWHHPVIEDYRARTAAGLYDQPLCNTCYTYLEKGG
jgi:MoaA/NifB/PqqE/SkfB family radical SAM enzyme